MKLRIIEKALTQAERDALGSSEFVFPQDRRYPIHDISHARNALARVSQHGTPQEKEIVRDAVRKKYPSIKVNESYLSEGKYKTLAYEFESIMSAWLRSKNNSVLKSKLHALANRLDLSYDVVRIEYDKYYRSNV